jgi:uncharacterized membrane protein
MAAALRIININQSLFGDEIVVQRMFISRGIPVILTYFPYTPHHVMYSLLAFFSQKIPIPIEISYRLPAVLASMGVVALSYIFARKFFTKFESAAIMFLNAVSFFAVCYSHVAKSYSITSLFVLIYLFALIMVIKNYQKFNGWFLLSLSLFVLLYMHVYNAYLSIGLIFMSVVIILYITEGKITLLILRRNPKAYARGMLASKRRSLAYGGNALLGFLLRRKLRTLIRGASLPWFKRFAAALLFAGALLFLCYSLQLPQVLEKFTIYRPRTSITTHISPAFLKGWLMHLTFWGEHKFIMYLCLLFAFIGLISLLRRKPSLATMIIIPPAVMLLIVYMTKSFIFPRYLLFTLPFFLMAFIEGAASFGKFIGKQTGSRITVVIFVIIFTAASSTVLLRYYKIGHQNIKGASEFIIAKALTTDKIVSFGEARDLFPFYEKRVKAVKTIEELEEILEQTSGNIYLLYGYKRALRNRNLEYNFIKKHFKPIKYFPGMYMDNADCDGEIFIEIAAKH